MPTSSPLNRAATSSALSELEPEGRNSASDVSPCSLRHVPPRTARVAGRQLRVVSRSKPVFFFIPSYPSACSFNAATTASPSAAVRLSPPRSAPRHPSASPRPPAAPIRAALFSTDERPCWERVCQYVTLTG